MVSLLSLQQVEEGGVSVFLLFLHCQSLSRQPSQFLTFSSSVLFLAFFGTDDTKWPLRVDVSLNQISNIFSKQTIEKKYMPNCSVHLQLSCIYGSRMISERLVVGVDWIKLPYILYVIGQTGLSRLSKQCKPRSDAAERGVWSGSTLFAPHPVIVYTFTGSKMDVEEKYKVKIKGCEYLGFIYI